MYFMVHEANKDTFLKQSSVRNPYVQTFGKTNHQN